MADDEIPPKVSVQEVARRVAMRLKLDFDRFQKENGNLPLPIQGRLADCRGMLIGIANGSISYGQPRILDNLLETLDALPQITDNKSKSTALEFVVMGILEALEQCASAGISVEGFDFGRRQGFSRR
jgi:hypothetical protein